MLRRVLLVASLLLAGATGYVLYALDHYKPLLENAVGRALGRSVSIAGDLSLAWSIKPAVTLRQVAVGNPAWADGKQFLRAEGVVVQFDALALLDRRVEVVLLELHNASIDLETATDGRDNWTFRSPGSSGFSFDLDALRVADSDLSYRSGSDPPRRLQVVALELTGLNEDTVELEATGRYEGVPLALSATAAGGAGAGQGKWPFSARLQSGDAVLTVSGSSATPFDFSTIEADFRLNGAAPEALLELTGIGPVAGVAVDFEARLTAVGGQHYQLSTFEARVGGSTLSGDLGLDLSNARPLVTGSVTATVFDSADFDAPGSFAENAGVDWSKQPLPFEVLSGFDARMTVGAGKMQMYGLSIDNADATLVLDDGRLQVDGLRAELPGLPVTGQVVFDSRANPPTIEISLDSDRVGLPQALRPFLPNFPIRGELRKLAVRLNSQGRTVAELIEGSHGSVVAGSGRFNVPDTGGGDTRVARLSRPRLSVEAGKRVRLRTSLESQGQSMRLDLSGGTLADLLPGGRGWPRIYADARTEINGQSLIIDGNFGSLAAVLAGGQVRVDMKAHSDARVVAFKGTLASPGQLSGARLAIDASGPSLDALSPLLGLQLPATEPYRIKVQMHAQKRLLRFTDLAARFGNNDLEGDIDIGLDQRKHVDATLRSKSLDLTPFLPSEMQHSSVDASIFETRLPLEFLDAADGKVKLRVGHLKLGEFGADDVVVDATLDNSRLKAGASAGGERLKLDIDLRPVNARWRLDLNHRGRLKLAWLLEEENNSDLGDDSDFSVDVKLGGIGNTGQELLGSADGYVELLIGKGRINKKLFVLPMGGVFRTLLRTINPLSKTQTYTSLECAALFLTLDQGIATSSKGIALQTEEINLIGGGALNLRNNEIELQFKTAQRKGLGISILGIADKFIRLTGTLNDPRVVIDPAGFLIQGVAAWATAGLSLVYEGIVSRLTASSDPCALVVEQADKEQATPK